MVPTRLFTAGGALSRLRLLAICRSYKRIFVMVCPDRAFLDLRFRSLNARRDARSRVRKQAGIPLYIRHLLDQECCNESTRQNRPRLPGPPILDAQRHVSRLGVVRGGQP